MIEHTRFVLNLDTNTTLFVHYVYAINSTCKKIMLHFSTNEVELVSCIF